MQNYMHLIRQKRMKKDISDKENQKEKLQVKEVVWRLIKSMRRVLKALSF